MHYRISSMRSRAKKDGKFVPDRETLEMLAENMTCSGCGRAMHWLRRDGAALQATLQHDRDGGIRLLCLGCNTRHSVHPGDSYYEIPKGKKQCRACARVLPATDFDADRSRPIGRKGHCRACSRKHHAAWVAKNRDHVNLRQREGRARRALLASRSSESGRREGT